MRRRPKITIVTPTFNSEKYLENCIISIKNQNYDNIEHIIVDGNSQDNTLSIVKKYEKEYNLKWISEPDNGMYDAINKGFAMASGDILGWLNSDDFYFPWTAEVVAKVFEQEDIQWLTGIPSNTKRMGDGDITYLLPNLPVVYNSSMIRKGIYDGNRMCFVQQESCFWSKGLWKKAGGLKSEFKLAGDYYLWREFAKYERLYTINCNFASFRIHEEQKSADKAGYSKEIDLKRCSMFLKVMIQIYLQLYSLINYRKYVLNIEKLFET